MEKYFYSQTTVYFGVSAELKKPVFFLSFDRPEKGVVTLDISVFTVSESFNALRQKL